MSTQAEHESRLLKTKRTAAHPAACLSSHGQSGPTTFVLRSEKELEKSMQETDSTPIQSSTSTSSDEADSCTSTVGDSSYGVQSLEDAMSASVDLGNSSTQTGSTAALPGASPLAGRKRKPGNPVHPKIYAAGQRIVSSEYSPGQASASASPRSQASNTSPSRLQKRSDSTSSAHLTPLRLSPLPESALPSTPRSNSMKSFRLSDEEASITSDTGSQVIQSSSSEEEQDDQQVQSEEPERESQLVMPSIAMPTRRPFTQRGRNMGKLKVMVVGACGLGKTSLIKSIFRLCEDIVHIDGLTGSTPSQSTTASKNTGTAATTQISEIQASTKPYPAWWSDMENSRSWWRRKSFGEGILDRNLCFVDTPGIDSDSMAQRILKEIDGWYTQAAALDNLNDTQLLNLLGGEGDVYLDAVFYLFDSTNDALEDHEIQLLRDLSKRTNVIPIIARSDLHDALAIGQRKAQITETLVTSQLEWSSLTSFDAPSHPQADHTTSNEIFAISSLTDDGDIMDASTLMASDYLPPLAASDLKDFVETCFSPTAIARLRHQATKKFLSWRREHISQQPGTSKPTLLNIAPSYKSPAVTSNGSMLDEPSKVLVPHAFSSYYRSTSPSASDSSALLFGPSAYSLGEHELEPASTAPSRHLHVAKWARDLRRSFRKEGVWAEHQQSRPAKGRLGGDLAIIDPRDPLGILSLSQAFGRRGWFALQVIGGFGVISAAVWWVTRNWIEVQEWLWPGQGGFTFAPVALPAPTRGWIDSIRLI